MLRKTLDNLHLYRPYLLVTAVSIIIFFPTWARLFEQWLAFEQVLAHGLATAVLFLILLIVHPPGAATAPGPFTKPHVAIGSALLILVTLAWALVEMVRIDTLGYLLLPPGMLCIAWTMLGLNSALRFLPYVLLLSLSLPIWADLIPALVDLASAVVSYWVKVFGMTALIEGNTITLPWGRLVIADGCSGIRYFAISILLAAVVSILNDYRWKGWAGLVAAAMVIGLIANWVRIFVLVVIGYESQMQSALLTDHELLGWVIYGAFILPALYFSPAKRRAIAHQTPGAPTFQRRGIAGVVIAVLAGPLLIQLTQFTATASPAWQASAEGLAPLDQATPPIRLKLPEFLQQQLWRDENDVWVSLAQSTRSRESDYKLVPYLRPAINDQVWLASETNHQVIIYQHLVTRQKVAVHQWYQVGSYQARNYRNAKLLQVPATLRGESRFALVTLMAECDTLNCENAIKAVRNQRRSLQLTPS